MRKFAFHLHFILFAFAGAAIADSPDSIIAGLADRCAANGGSLEFRSAITTLDMDRSGVVETIVEPSKATCIGAESEIWCGSGGCWMFFFSQHGMVEILSYDWTVVRGPGVEVLLARVRGDSCGSQPADICVRAFTVNDDRISRILD